MRRFLVPGLVLLASSSVLACGDPTGNEDRIGRATLNVETPEGEWTYSDGEAGFRVECHPPAGPCILSLAVSAGGNTPGAVEIYLSQILGADTSPRPEPKPGTYQAAGGGAGACVCPPDVLRGHILYLEDGKVTTAVPIPESTTVTFLEVSPERISGQFSIFARRVLPSENPFVRASGTFEAVPVGGNDLLPRPLSRPRR